MTAPSPNKQVSDHLMFKSTQTSEEPNRPNMKTNPFNPSSNQYPMQIAFAIFLLSIHAVSSLSAGENLSWKAWLGDGADSVWADEERSLDLNNKPLQPAWKHELGSGYSGPSIDGNVVVVMDWHLNRGEKGPTDVFARGTLPGSEGIVCFDLATGEINWQHRYPETYTISYPAGPRTTPILTDTRVIALGAEGRLSVLNRENGTIVWEKDFKETYQSKTPLWGFAGHPLLIGNTVICLVGGENNAGVVAFDVASGKEQWRALNFKEMGYAPPTLIERKGRKELIIWSGDGIFSIDPRHGTSHWDIRWPLRFALSIPTPRQYKDQLYFTCFYDGSTMLDLKQDPPTILWQTRKSSEKDTTHLNSIMSTPFLHQGHIYGVCSYGQFRCLEIASGKRLWETMDVTTGNPDKQERWANVFLIKNGPANRFLLFNESGYLIDCELTPEGYNELGRMQLIKPNGKDLRIRPIVWSHPALTQDVICVRNDDSIACYRF
jgi:outer membrane protein assembly factor BamB